MRHVPFTTPVAVVMRTQCPANHDGMSDARSVTSVAPFELLCAMPLPRAGNSVRPAMQSAGPSIVTSPYVDCGPLRYFVPAPPHVRVLPFVPP